MTKNFTKIFAAVIFTLTTFLSAGCFQGESNLTIDADGKVTLKNEIMGVPLLREYIENAKNDLERKNKVIDITPISSGNLSGYRITTQYTSVEQFAAQNIELYAGRAGKCKGIQQRKGWLFDSYNFDFVSEAPESGEYLDNPLAQSMMPQIKFDMVINLPYSAESSNAQNSTNDNKTLSWNLTSSMTSGKDVSIQARFKIWHRDKIILTVAAIVALLGSAIYFSRKAKTFEEGSYDAAKNLKFMQICMALAAAIISASVYMLIAPVEFTDADIIGKLPQ